MFAGVAFAVADAIALPPTGDVENIAEAEVAGDELIFSAVDILENAIRASGKLGGVAGVFAGVHIGFKCPP